MKTSILILNILLNYTLFFPQTWPERHREKCRVAKKKKKNDKYILLEGKRGKYFILLEYTAKSETEKRERKNKEKQTNIETPFIFRGSVVWFIGQFL